MQATRRERRPNRRGHGAQLRDEIVGAAIAIIDREGGHEALTLRSVAREAGIAAPSIYPHFADLDAVLDAVIEAFFAQLGERVVAASRDLADPVEALSAGCHAYAAFAFQLLVNGVEECARAGRSASTDPFADASHLWTALHGVVTLRGHDAVPVAAGGGDHRSPRPPHRPNRSRGDSMTDMRAVLAEEAGRSFRYAAVPRPVPKAGEALVAVHAAAITKDELTWRESWPAIPSFEISGVVAELGPGTTGVAAGDEVFALLDFEGEGGGGAAEFVSVPAAALAPKPATVDHVAAASLPLAALTALQAFADHARLAPGQRVLVHGGAGGVGNYGVQLAAALGAEVVATASAKDADYVRGLGATTVIDYRTAFEEKVDPVDVVLDTVGGAVLDRSWGVIRPGGILVAVGTPPPQGDAEKHGVRGEYFIVAPDRAQLTEISAMVDDGRIRPQVGLVRPMREAAAAFEVLVSGHPRGKVVLAGDVGSDA